MDSWVERDWREEKLADNGKKEALMGGQRVEWQNRKFGGNDSNPEVILMLFNDALTLMAPGGMEL